MLNIFGSFILALVLPVAVWASPATTSHEAMTLMEEYERLYDYIQTVHADGDVAGYMDYKNMGDYDLMWRQTTDPKDHSIIRIFSRHEDGSEAFAVTYYLTSRIINGRTVLRRFIGPESNSSFRVDTVDVHTGEYLGQQGHPTPKITDEDQKILNEWGIQLLD